MTEDEVIRLAAGLPGVRVETATESTGAPEVAWGDSFIYYDLEGAPLDSRFPFATVVVTNYPGFDEASDLDRDGVFRLNVSAGRQRFTELFGYPPVQHDEHTHDLDYTVLDTVLPHPVYAKQGWVSILNPGELTSDLARTLIVEARDRTAARRRPHS